MLLEISAVFGLLFSPQVQPAPPPPSARANPLVRAVAHRTDRAPVIDGVQDDAIWATAPRVSDFRQFQPREGADPSFRTEFQVSYDAHNLYIFVRAFDPHPDSIMHALTRRDVRGPSDQIVIFIDAYNDKRTGIDLDINPDGVKRDYAIYNDGQEDESWNGIWDVGTRVDSLGWTAEVRVPLSQLRYADRPEHTFGFAIWRDIERYKERVSWPQYRPTKSGLASQFGELTGITGISSPRSLELTPYAVTKNVTRERTAGGFDRSQKLTLGGDLKYGLTPNVTLDATVNPDFGQVEADPAVLNLTAFETFVRERRPFFVEGVGLYRFNLNCYIVNDCNTNEGLFYSRRIGRAPQLSDDYGDAATPTATPILAAGKLTGRTMNGLSYGVLNALTQRVGGVENKTVEPRSNYTVLSVQQDLRGGQSGVGLIGTVVDRSLDEWTSPTLRDRAYVAGANMRHKLGGGQYELTASATASRVTGTAQSIAETQKSSVHYYQRPDDSIVFDSTRTALSGHAEEITFGKFGGGIVRFQTAYARQSAGYEVNDLGYLQRAGQQTWATWAALTFRKPKAFYRSLQVNGNHWQQWTSEGMRLDNAFNANAHVTFLNNWNAHAGSTIGQLGESYCDFCARGGPAMRRSRVIYPWFGINGDDRNAIVPSMWVNLGYRDEGRSNNWSLNPSVELRVSTQLQVELGVNIARDYNDAQWYDNIEDDAGITHYAFAHMEQRTLSMNARVNYTARPNLTFELYAEPFVSTGTYTNFRELSDNPRAAAYVDRFRPYAPPADSDTGFENAQLRSTAVLRWEYLPGSTVFLVWTHGREDSLEQNYNRGWRTEYRDLFSLHPDNTFLIKVAYWINR